MYKKFNYELIKRVVKVVKIDIVVKVVRVHTIINLCCRFYFLRRMTNY